MPLVALAVLALATGCARGPQPPDLKALGTLDPQVAALLADLTAAVRDSASDGNRWGELGMAFEANGFTAQAKDAYASAATLPSPHGRWWYHVARMKARDGDTDGALAAFDRAIALSAEYVPARWRRGQLLLDRGDLDGAEAAFHVAANLAPSDPAGPVGLARVYLARGQHQAAADALDAVIAHAPAERYLYQLLAAAYRGLGRAADAEEANAAGAPGEPAWADPWTDEMLAYRRGFAAALKEATALATAARYPEAIALLESLRADHPDDRELRTYLGGVYATAGRFADAKRLLDQVLAAAPDDFDALMHMATAYLLTDDYLEADRFAVRALAQRPADADATRLRGVAAWRSKRLDDAERLLAAAAAANPKDAKALAWIGSIRLERGQAAPALEAFRQALARDPLLGDALVDGAAAAAAAGARDEGLRWLARAKRVAPSHPKLADVERRLAVGGRP